MKRKHRIFKFNRVTDLIYLGTNLCCTTIPHVRVLLDLGIKADIDLEKERQEQTPNIETYLWLPVKDHSAPIQEQLDTGVAVIESLVRNGQKMYIHCKNGHGRSPTLLAAYFIKQGMRVHEAIAKIKAKRPEIHLNKIQTRALQAYEKRRRQGEVS